MEEEIFFRPIFQNEEKFVDLECDHNAEILALNAIHQKRIKEIYENLKNRFAQERTNISSEVEQTNRCVFFKESYTSDNIVDLVKSVIFKNSKTFNISVAAYVDENVILSVVNKHHAEIQRNLDNYNTMLDNIVVEETEFVRKFHKLHRLLSQCSTDSGRYITGSGLGAKMCCRCGDVMCKYDDKFRLHSYRCG